jgi:type II secretory pathway pseudopilin PulG
MTGMFILLMALIIGLSLLTIAGPKLITQVYARNENETSEKYLQTLNSMGYT